MEKRQKKVGERGGIRSLRIGGGLIGAETWGLNVDIHLGGGRMGRMHLHVLVVERVRHLPCADGVHIDF